MPGRIVKRSKSSWTVIVDLAPDPVTGRRRQLSRAVSGPKRNAEEKLVELLGERNAGIEHPRNRLTVAEYLDRWLADYVSTTLVSRRGES